MGKSNRRISKSMIAAIAASVTVVLSVSGLLMGKEAAAELPIAYSTLNIDGVNELIQVGNQQQPVFAGHFHILRQQSTI